MKFLANKEVSSKELFCKKLGGINYCTTIAATCEQVPSLICTLFEKFAEAKNEYIEIEKFLDKHIKGKGRYADSIRHDQKAVEKAAKAFHTSPARIKKLFSLYLAHRILISELIEKAEAFDEAKGNVGIELAKDVASDIPTDFAGLIVTGIKVVSAGVRYLYYKKMSEKNKELARRYFDNIFAIQRFLNVMGCIASLFDILSHKNSFDHAMESNVLVCHLDERRITDVKEQLEHYDHNHGCFCGFLDKGEANGETMQQWISKNQPVWSKLKKLFESKDSIKTRDGTYYYIDYDTLGERMKREKLFEDGFKRAETFHYHPLLSPLLEVGLSIAQIDKFRKSFEELKSVNIIYDSDIDEKSAKACHKKIDGKGPTITFAVKGDKMIGGIAYQDWTAGDGRKLDEFIRDPFAAVFCITQEMQVCPVKCYDRALYGDIGYGPIFGYNELCVNLNEMSISTDNGFCDYNLPSSFRESFYEPDETGMSKVDRIVVLSFEYDSEKLVQRMFGDKEKANNFIIKCETTGTAERALRKTQSTKEAEELVMQCPSKKEIDKRLDEIKIERKEYQERMNDGNIRWLFNDETLTVGGKGEMKDYENEDTRPWDMFKERIKKVIISEGLTTIGKYAFSKCSSLTSITIPNSVTTIGRYGFYKCSSLKSITILNNFTTVRKKAFQGCSSLTSITIPNSVTTIGDKAFSGCSSLTSLTLTGAGEMKINPNEISNKLVTVIISNGITTIEDNAFSFCYSLTSITIPDSMIMIGDYAFYDCPSLTSIIIPNSVTSIGERAFEYCSSLTSLTLTGAGEMKINPNEISNKFVTVIISNGITTIEDNAFSGCSSLTSITIPDSVTTIGGAAFARCSSLTSVTIPSSVKTIGGGAFYNCSSLTSMTIPNSVTTIGDSAFRNCSSLLNVTMPEKFESSKDTIFMGTPYLQESMRRSSTAKQCRALYPFNAMQPGDLSFKAGDIITIVERTEEDWWEGELNGVRGQMPANYVQEL